MAGSAKDSQRWIADEESIQNEMQIHRTANYGTNLRSVTEALEAQRERNNLVVSYEKDVNKLSKDAREAVTDSYDTLRIVSEKRLNCLEDIASIAGLEDILGKLSVEFATKASSLVASECNRQEFVPENAGDGIKAAAQNCILAVRDNWMWISKLVKCTDSHLKNSSEYHEFFHEVKENEAWMPVELKAAQNKVKLHETTEGNSREGQRWLLDIKELLTLFLHWQGKLEKLFERSKKIVPVNLRTKKLDYYRPVESLVPYKTSEIDVREGEELLLIDNSNTQSWMVRNHNSVESKVPSVICLIPGPDPDAMQAAMRLRFQLLTEWTLCIKRVGKSLILFNILVLKDWNNDEIKKLQAIPKEKKTEIVRILEFLLESLRPNWTGYAGFTELERRVGKMKDILKKDGSPRDRDQDFERELLARLGALEGLFNSYGTMWSQWEAYKILVEASRHADNLLIVDKWQQLKFINMDELRKLWQQSLEFGDGDNMDFESWLKRMMELWSRKVHTDSRDGNLRLAGPQSLEQSSERTGELSSEQSSSTSYVTTVTTEQTMEDMQGRLGDLDSKFNMAERRQQELLEQLESKRLREAELRDQEMRERERRDMERMEEETRLMRLREEEERMRRLKDDEDRLLRERQEQEERERSDWEVREERTVTTKTVREPAGLRTGQEYNMVEESYETTGMLGKGRNGFEEAELETTTQTSSARETATTDQVTHAEQEEKKTFVITGVIDPRTGEEVSMHQAVMLGIINSQEGTYVNPDTRHSIPIPEAMSEGHIKVEFTTSRKTQEKRRDVGLITIRTQRESRPYTVRSVIDAKTDDTLSVDDAIRRRILDQKNGVYFNTLTEQDMSLADALDSGLLIVEYDNNAIVADPEVVSKTYSIHGVVDQRRRAKVSFSDAIRSGLLNRETGAYYHNVDREYIYVGDAIKRGFIKASLVKDPNSLDIDPENRVVVETLETMKRKLLNPLKTMAAFKKAAGVYQTPAQIGHFPTLHDGTSVDLFSENGNAESNTVVAVTENGQVQHTHENKDAEEDKPAPLRTTSDDANTPSTTYPFDVEEDENQEDKDNDFNEDINEDNDFNRDNDLCQIVPGDRTGDYSENVDFLEGEPYDNANGTNKSDELEIPEETFKDDANEEPDNTGQRDEMSDDLPKFESDLKKEENYGLPGAGATGAGATGAGATGAGAFGAGATGTDASGANTTGADATGAHAYSGDSFDDNCGASAPIQPALAHGHVPTYEDEWSDGADSQRSGRSSVDGSSPSVYATESIPSDINTTASEFSQDNNYSKIPGDADVADVDDVAGDYDLPSTGQVETDEACSKDSDNNKSVANVRDAGVEDNDAEAATMPFDPSTERQKEDVTGISDDDENKIGAATGDAEFDHNEGDSLKRNSSNTQLSKSEDAKYVSQDDTDSFRMLRQQNTGNQFEIIEGSHVTEDLVDDDETSLFTDTSDMSVIRPNQTGEQPENLETLNMSDDDGSISHSGLSTHGQRSTGNQYNVVDGSQAVELLAVDSDSMPSASMSMEADVMLRSGRSNDGTDIASNIGGLSSEQETSGTATTTIGSIVDSSPEADIFSSELDNSGVTTTTTIDSSIEDADSGRNAALFIYSTIDCDTLDGSSSRENDVTLGALDTKECSNDQSGFVDLKETNESVDEKEDGGIKEFEDSEDKVEKDEDVNENGLGSSIGLTVTGLTIASSIKSSVDANSSSITTASDHTSKKSVTDKNDAVAISGSVSAESTDADNTNRDGDFGSSETGEASSIRIVSSLSTSCVDPIAPAGVFMTEAHASLDDGKHGSTVVIAEGTTIFRSDEKDDGKSGSSFHGTTESNMEEFVDAIEGITTPADDEDVYYNARSGEDSAAIRAGAVAPGARALSMHLRKGEGLESDVDGGHLVSGSSTHESTYETAESDMSLRQRRKVETVGTDSARERALARKYLEVVAGHVPADSESSSNTTAMVSTGSYNVIGSDVDGKHETVDIHAGAETARASLIVEDTDFQLISSVGGDQVSGVTTGDETSVIILNTKLGKSDTGKTTDESRSPKGKKKRRRRPKHLAAGSTGDSGYSEGSTSDFSPPSSRAASRASSSSLSSLRSGSASLSDSGVDSDVFTSIASSDSLLGVLHEETFRESGTAETNVDTGDVFHFASSGSSLDVLPVETIKEAGDFEMHEYAIAGDDESTLIVSPVPIDNYTLRRRLEVLQDTSGVLCRACRCALPLQALMVLLLGVACLLPMAEEEFGCALTNNFQSSLAFMLKYTDGPPPT